MCLLVLGPECPKGSEDLQQPENLLTDQFVIPPVVVSLNDTRLTRL